MPLPDPVHAAHCWTKKILWWLVLTLSGLLSGGASRHLSNIDRIASVETEVKVIGVKMDAVLEQGKRKGGGQ